MLAGPAPAAGRALLRDARTCYDHLAGRLGVELLDVLMATRALRNDSRVKGLLQFGPNASYVFSAVGVDIERLAPSRRRLAYRCLDWTERRDHLGGSLGASVAAALLEQGLVVRRRGATRALDVAPSAWLKIESLRRKAIAMSIHRSGKRR